MMEYYLAFKKKETLHPVTTSTHLESIILSQIRERLILYGRGVKLIFTEGHISLEVDFKGLNVILGLYKCNYSLKVK